MHDQGSKPTGLTKSTGWQIGVRRTLPVPAEMIWELLLSPKGIRIWLGEAAPFSFEKNARYSLSDGTTGKITTFQPDSHWRITRLPPDPTYQRPAVMQIRVIDLNDRCTVVFHEEHLPDEEARMKRKTFYLEVIDRIKSDLLVK